MGITSQNTFLTLAFFLAAAVGVGCSDVEPSLEAVKTADLPELPNALSTSNFPRSTEQNARNLTVAIVGEVRGELEPCGCPTLPYGGFERRHTQLDHLRAESSAPLFHLDLGDMLVKGISTARGDELSERAKEMTRLSRMVGVDLWVPGPSDLVAMTPDALVGLSGPLRASATWINPETQTPLLPPFAVLERDGIRVGVIGLSAPPPSGSNVDHRSAVDSVAETLPLLPSDLDWIVAAGNIGDEEADSVANIEGLSAVFSTRGEAYDDPPMNRPHRIVIETPDRGRYLQVVHVRLGTDPSSPLLLYPDPPDWRARLASLRRGGPDTLEDQGRGRNLGLINTIPLSADLDRVGSVSARLDTYQAERRERAVKSAALPPKEGPHYASSGACVNCHSDEFARWTLTGHARAWRSLLERGETSNPECIECHTTAYGEPGGFGEIEPKNIRKFKGVQCEMCHGPLGGHPNDARVEATTISAETCTGCHDEANSPKFNYDTYLPAASCQGGAPELVPQPAGG